MKDERRELVSINAYCFSAVLLAIILLWGKFYLADGNEMGYILLNFYIVIPLTSFVIGTILGIKNGYFKFAYPIVFGVLTGIVLMVVFDEARDLVFLFFSFVPSSVGLLVGIFINNRKHLL